MLILVSQISILKRNSSGSGKLISARSYFKLCKGWHEIEWQESNLN